ncbi:MAG: ABC transporter ATP-binding protein [Candidatus Rokubacteria bacterium]|nr:ABC transporter ATP-binding protein [Candidatus Rokubacteria bacterium]
MSVPALLETRRLTKAFGGLMAVTNVHFAVERGEIRAIIGPNGAGKTTFFNMIAGDLPPTAGRVIFKGQDITAFPPHRRSHLGIGRSYQITNVFPDLTVLENVRVAAQTRRTTFRFWQDADRLNGIAGRAERLLDSVGLADKALVPARTLAHGEQRHLEIAIALATDPELLLLDEPTAGMSPEERGRTAETIKRVAADLTVILVEHDMDVVMGISDRITVLHHGEILAEGTPGAIRSNADVQRVYLRE